MSRNTIKVLIVDDKDVVWVQGLMEYLRKDGTRIFACRTADCPREAKDASISETPDAFVLDLKLEGEKPSKELLQWIPEHCRKAAVVVVTDDPSVPITADFMALCDAFVAKSDDGAYERVRQYIVDLTAEKRQLTVEEIADSLAAWGRMHGKERVVLKCGGDNYTAEQLAEEVRLGTPLGKEFQSAMLERVVTSLSASPSAGAMGEEAKRIVRERMAAFMAVIDEVKPR